MSVSISTPEALWEHAEELAGDKLSPIIVDGLKKCIAQKQAEEADARGFQRILLSCQDAKDNDIPKQRHSLANG